MKNPRAWKARPARELRDFQKIILEAGEEKEFVFSISRELFELYDERVDERTVPQGMYGLELGFSVQDIRASQKIEVTPVFPVPKQIQGWDKTERLLETKAGEQIFEELYRKITEKAGGIFAQRLKEEKNVREMLLSQPIRIVHLMIWNEMTDSELIAILEILSGGKKKLQTGKVRKTVGRTDEMVPGCEVWHVYSLGSIFDARKRGMGADE